MSYFIKNTLLSLLFPTLLFLVFSVNLQAQSFPQELRLWDNKPAGDWMTEAYPMGNGRIGGMVFGGTAREHIQFNEISMWTGNEKDRGAYQPFGDLYISFNHIDSATVPADYIRESDIRNAVQSIRFSDKGIHYSREYFTSFPDKVMVLNYNADEKASYSGTIFLESAHGAQTTAEGTQLQFSGKLSNGMAYHSRLMVRNKGGKVRVKATPDGHYQISFDQVDQLTLFLAAATDYSNKREQNWKGENPDTKVNRILASVAEKDYISIKNDHIQDYQKLFGRVNIHLGNTLPELAAMTTRERLINYRKKPDPELEALLFQYGRYLLINSSRKGGLPANLQGLWNNTDNPPWGSDYHSNINIQMNYWLAEPTNLTESHFPYLDYINSMREVKKENTQEEYPGVRGWTVKTENNIFGGESFLWNTPGSAWYARAIWDHYAFTKDKKYLREFAYPILKEITEFWDDHLKRRDDGTLVAPMGWSPEHGPKEDGVTHDQQIVYDLFTNYIEAAGVLGIDKVYKEHVENMRERLLKPKIGKWGQLQEWETDRDDPDNKHRHVSHLYGLHPGREISVAGTPELAEAAKVSLLARGDESTGWSMAWKMNFWARLHDGDHAYKILQNFITLVGGSKEENYSEGGGIYSNLFCSHPPFQIDGNLGYTAGVAEMLVQSQTPVIEFLPALPAAWNSGSVQGLKARGNFEISNLEWQNGKIVKLEIKSLSGGDCQIRVPNALLTTVKTTHSSDQFGENYKFKTKKGRSYVFKMNEDV